MQHHNAWQALAATVALAATMAGCAGKGPQGYGVSEQASTAAQAQQQMQKAEQATEVDTAQTYLDLIAQMQQAGQWYASLAHTEAFEQQYGVHTQARLMRADALRNTGQFKQARQAYLLLLDGATAARARRGLGLLLASQGQFAQAVEQLEKARQLNPIDANVLSDLAYAHMLDGRLAAAQLPILQASQLAPGNARVQLNLALFWLASGEQAQASQLLQRLSQPQGRGMAALIDQTSLQTLQSQLASVRLALRSRADGQPAQPAPAAPPPPTGTSPVIGSVVIPIDVPAGAFAGPTGGPAAAAPPPAQAAPVSTRLAQPPEAARRPADSPL